MEEITPNGASEELREEENITEIGDSVTAPPTLEASNSPEELAESISPDPVVDDYPQCRLSDDDVERIAKAISKNIVVTLRGE